MEFRFPMLRRLLLPAARRLLVRFVKRFPKIRLRVPVFFLEDFLLVLCVMLCLILLICEIIIILGPLLKLIRL